MGIDVAHVRASGGGARSGFWRQLQADIYKTPVVVTNATEGPAYGVAVLAGVGTGAWDTVQQACEASIEQTRKVTPKPKAAELYDRQYAVYDKLYPDLKERFAEMAGLVA